MADKVRVAVLISGRGSNMVALEEWKRRGERSYRIVMAGSNDPEARGLMAAKILGLPIWAESHKGLEREAFDRLLDAQLKAREVEVVALAGYMRLLSPWFIEEWRGRILNIHPSVLPDYKGLDTHKRAILAGEQFAGCSVHVVTEELDGGPVIAQAKVRIRERETPDMLAERVLKEEHTLYPEALDIFCQTLRSASQPTISSAEKK